MFEAEIEYLTTWILGEIKNNTFIITRNGVTHLSGFIAMFYSDRSKQELMDMNVEKLLRYIID